MGPTWDPRGSCRPQMGPMLAPWTLLSGPTYHPGSKEIPTPRSGGRGFEKEWVLDGHVVGNSVGYRAVSAYQQYEVIDVGEEEQWEHDREEHRHPGTLVVQEHLQFE